METARTILLVDSNEQSALDIQRFLKVSPFSFIVSHASDIPEGLNYIKNGKPDLILLDVEIVNQKDFASFKLVSSKEKIPFILLSEMSLKDTQRYAEISGAADYMVKNKINLFHLQKSVISVLKLNEAEAKVGDTSTELNAQQDALYQLLNKIDSGVLVINSRNAIRFANTKAYSVLGEEGIRKYLADHLSYRMVEEEEVATLKTKGNFSLNIRISHLKWNGEDANLFVLDRVKISEEKADAFLDDQTLHSLLNSISENVLLMKGDNIVLANQPALKKLKLKQTEILSKRLKDVIETKEPLLAEISVQSFLSEKETEGVLKFPDGATQPVKFSMKPMNLAGEFYQLVVFVIKEEPQNQNMPKQRSDGDMFSTEGMLHLASHDLREPVRTILNYVQLISDNLSNKKYEEATEYAGFAKAAAGRMDKLLSDLKTYLALNDHPFQLSKISMKQTLADVMKQLKARIELEEAELSYTELPEVNADRALVEKLFFQLIDNAILFHRKGKKPVIDIGYDKFEGNVIFCVRDNGIGISKKYYQKIFEPFERLNRVDEFPGNGLGLAICKRITEMHGGEIWVESLPGSGSNFYFTLKSK